MRRALTVMTACAALALAGCSSPEEDAPDGDPTPTDDGTPTPTSDPDTDDGATDGGSDTDDVAAMSFTTCAGARYAVGYPEDWETNEPGDLLGACEIFHPDAIDEPEQPRDRDLHHAVSVYVDDVPFEDWLERDVQGEVLEERDVTVDGAPARVVEVASSGDALVPDGERRYAYTVDLGGRILVAATYSVGETDYERDRQVLDRMVTEELTLAEGPDPVAGPATTDVVEAEASGPAAVVTDLRVGGHEGFDRVVFEIGGDGEPGWRLEYVDDPRSQGSGDEVDIAGEAVLAVTLRGIAYPMDAPAEPRDGPDRLEPAGTATVGEIVDDTLYEGYHQFFIGLDDERPYRVARLADPQRVVVDIETG